MIGYGLAKSDHIECFDKHMSAKSSLFQSVNFRCHFITSDDKVSILSCHHYLLVIIKVPIIFPVESFVSNRLQQYRLETGSEQVKKGLKLIG